MSPCRLDPSIGGSGPHAFAVRAWRPSSVDTNTSTASRATFRDDREAPLAATRDDAYHTADLSSEKENYFSPEGLTRFRKISPVEQISCPTRSDWRRRPR